MAPPRIFVSHSHTDDDFGIRLVEDLRQALGDDDAVWYDSGGGLHGGDPWWRKIVGELTTRNTFIVVLSPDSMDSQWVNDEIDMAWRLKNSPVKMHIIPVLSRKCEIRGDLQNLQIIQFLPPKPYETAFGEVLTALGLPADTLGRSPVEGARNTLFITLTRPAIVMRRLNMFLGIVPFLTVIVAIVTGKIAPDQSELTNTLGLIAYLMSPIICLSELYVLAVYRQWRWLVGLLVVGTGVYLSNSFFVFGVWIYFVATSIPLVFGIVWYFISGRTIAIKP